MDPVNNLAYSRVVTPPDPADSGTTLELITGDAASWNVPFNAVIWPRGAIPVPANAEIVRVTDNTDDILTIVRAQEGTSARSIEVGDQFAATISHDLLAQLDLRDQDLQYFMLPLTYLGVWDSGSSYTTSNAVAFGDPDQELWVATGPIDDGTAPGDSDRWLDVSGIGFAVVLSGQTEVGPAADGVPAPVGSIFLNNNDAVGELWEKAAVADDQWTQLTSGGGGGVTNPLAEDFVVTGDGSAGITSDEPRVVLGVEVGGNNNAHFEVASPVDGVAYADFTAVGVDAAARIGWFDADSEFRVETNGHTLAINADDLVFDGVSLHNSFTYVQSDAPDAPSTGETWLQVRQVDDHFPAWQPETVYKRGSRVEATVGNGFFFEAQIDGQVTAASGDTEPTWPTVESGQVDDTGEPVIHWIAQTIVGSAFITGVFVRTVVGDWDPISPTAVVYDDNGLQRALWNQTVFGVDGGIWDDNGVKCWEIVWRTNQADFNLLFPGSATTRAHQDFSEDGVSITFRPDSEDPTNVNYIAVNARGAEMTAVGFYGQTALSAGSRPSLTTAVTALDVVDNYNALRTALIALGLALDGDIP